MKVNLRNTITFGLVLMLVIMTTSGTAFANNANTASSKLENVISIFEESAGFEPNVGAARTILSLVLKISGIGLGLIGFGVFLSITWTFAVDLLYLSARNFWDNIAEAKDPASGAGGAMKIFAAVIPNVRNYTSFDPGADLDAYRDVMTPLTYLTRNMGKSIAMIIFAAVLLSGQAFTIAGRLIRGLGGAVDAIVYADYSGIIRSYDVNRPKFEVYKGGTNMDVAKMELAQKVYSSVARVRKNDISKEQVAAIEAAIIAKIDQIQTNGNYREYSNYAFTMEGSVVTDEQLAGNGGVFVINIVKINNEETSN